MPQQIMLTRVFFPLLGLALVFGGLTAVKQRRGATVTAKAAAGVAPRPVAVTPALAGPLPLLLAAIGTLEAVRQVVVAPEVGGRVVAIHFALRAGPRYPLYNCWLFKGESL